MVVRYEVGAGVIMIGWRWDLGKRLMGQEERGK